MKDIPLAILIPAYKPDFLKEAIESILAQTNQHFILYVFDDASPYGIREIVSEFLSTPNLKYHRFEENLGQHSLTKQWDRCIRGTTSEPWIWLFSDDDRMESHCVQTFYDELEKHPDISIFRLKSKKVDSNGKVLRVNEFPNPLTPDSFLQKKLSYEQESYMIESPFKRSLYQQIGGFPELPLAWAADDLFYLRMYKYGTAFSIADASVEWRYSSENVSGKKSRVSAIKKLEASRIFVNEIRQESSGSIQLSPEKLPEMWFIRQVRTLRNQISLLDECKAMYRLEGGLRSWMLYAGMKWRRWIGA